MVFSVRICQVWFEFDPFKTLKEKFITTEQITFRFFSGVPAIHYGENRVGR